jgi:hypothetical protein
MEVAAHKEACVRSTGVGAEHGPGGRRARSAEDGAVLTARELQGQLGHLAFKVGTPAAKNALSELVVDNAAHVALVGKDDRCLERVESRESRRVAAVDRACG